MTTSASTTRSPSRRSTTRSTPCVLGCCGPMLMTSSLVSNISLLLAGPHPRSRQHGGHRLHGEQPDVDQPDREPGYGVEREHPRYAARVVDPRPRHVLLGGPLTSRGFVGTRRFDA